NPRMRIPASKKASTATAMTSIQESRFQAFLMLHSPPVAQSCAAGRPAFSPRPIPGGGKKSEKRGRTI
ncbi:MAG: hypothetical protein PUB63_06065, partial [Clostridia bacterium]|nr:hypothetical protein [Clostridia bacterium]